MGREHGVLGGPQVGTLRALSTLCSEREASRKQVVDAGAMPHIVRALDHLTPEARAGSLSPAPGCGKEAAAPLAWSDLQHALFCPFLIYHGRRS